MSTPTQSPRQVEVTLAKAHTHAGQQCAAGDKIKVSERERAWLANHKIINAPAPAKAGDK